MSRVAAVLSSLQAIGALIALSRLARWRRLPPPLDPGATGAAAGTITVVVPTYNETARLAPLLGVVPEFGPAVRQIIFVDSRSTDGTTELIARATAGDARIIVMQDDPLPARWIGKAWALECARRHATGTWLLGLDADTAPRAELPASVVAYADQHGLDALSLSPRFAGQSALERWLQPSLLMSLLYRVGPSSTDGGRVLANGQCFLVRADVLDRLGGFAPVRESFAEDVSLARHLAAHGARVSFGDGRRLLDVRSYASARQMWREWGRSIDLKDSATRGQLATDIFGVTAVQGAPLVVLALLAAGVLPANGVVIAMNVGLLLVRVLMSFALRASYAQRGVAYWLSPLSDPLGAMRLVLSSLTRPSVWRGRSYARAAR